MKRRTEISRVWKKKNAGMGMGKTVVSSCLLFGLGFVGGAV